MLLHCLGKHEPWKLGLFSHAIYCVCFALLCLRHLSTSFYNFFVDSKAVVLSTVYKCYFSLGHFCVTPVRQQGHLRVLHHLLLPEQWLTHPIIHSFCNNTGRQGLRSSFSWETLWLKCLPFKPFKSNKLLIRILSSSVNGMSANTSDVKNASFSPL